MRKNDVYWWSDAPLTAPEPKPVPAKPDPQLADRLRSLRNYGSTDKYAHDEVGWNSRLDDFVTYVSGIG